MNKRLLLLPLLAAFVAGACAVPTLVPTAQPLPSPSPTWTLLAPATATPEPTLAPSATSVAAATAAATLTRTPAPPTATVEAFACPGAPPPRVAVGDEARVTFTDGLPLRVRDTPVVSNNVIAQISEGTAFQIVAGPRCAAIPGTVNAFVFWQIEVDATGLTGWVAEGDAANYFIEVVP